jgi:drug/metabolite transporter (DMT)-like permease
MAMVGANVAVAKAASPFLPVFVFALVRFVVAAVVLVPFAWNEPGRPLRGLPGREWRELFLQALFGVLLYMSALRAEYTSAMSAGIITATVPAIVAGLAVLMLGERWACEA